MRSTTACVLVAVCFAFAGCALDDGEEGTLDQALAGGRMCTTSLDCGDGSYCTTETGDCLTPSYCKNRPCALVCWGQCEKLVTCGPTVCDPGWVCCNESCGICSEPGGYCTMNVCTEIPNL